MGQHLYTPHMKAKCDVVRGSSNDFIGAVRGTTMGERRRGEGADTNRSGGYGSKHAIYHLSASNVSLHSTTTLIRHDLGLCVSSQKASSEASLLLHPH